MAGPLCSIIATMFCLIDNVTKSHIFAAKKLKTSSLLHFDAIDIRAELVLGQAFFDKILLAFEKKSQIFISLIF